MVGAALSVFSNDFALRGFKIADLFLFNSSLLNGEMVCEGSVLIKSLSKSNSC